MTQAYLKNLVGLDVPPAEMEQIPHPYAELYTHTIYRGVQLGVVVSMAVAAPLAVVVRGPRTLAALTQRAARFGRWGALLGLPLGPAMTYRMTRNDPEIAIYDRCYRLRYNFNQVRQDRFGVASTLAGAAYAGATGALWGVLAGIALGTVYNTAVAPPHQKAPKYEELKALVKEAKAALKQQKQEQPAAEK